MTIFTYRNIIDYFILLAEQHNEVASSYQGDDEQIQGATLSNIAYPCLWIETPEATLLGDMDMAYLNWTCAIVVLYNAANDDIDKKQMNLDKSLDIVKDIIGRMRKDVIDNTLLGVSFTKSTLDQVYDSELSDSVQGYRFTFNIKTANKELCYDADKWTI